MVGGRPKTAPPPFHFPGPILRQGPLDISVCIYAWYITFYHAMLCYAMLCYAMLCYAMLCYALLCYAMLCGKKSKTVIRP